MSSTIARVGVSVQVDERQDAPDAAELTPFILARSLKLATAPLTRFEALELARVQREMREAPFVQRKKAKPRKRTTQFVVVRIDEAGNRTQVSGNCGSWNNADDAADTLNRGRDAMERAEGYTYEARKVTQ